MKLIFFLTWSAESIIVIATANNQKLQFAISDTKLYVPVGDFMSSR